MKFNDWSRLVILGLSLAAGTAVADEAVADETWRKDRFGAELGFYRPNVSTKVRVADPDTGLGGTLLDLESDLDLSDRESLVTLDLHWRFARRHAIEFEFVELKRKSVHPIQFEIEFEGEIFEVDEVLESVFDTSIGRLGYRFSFINNEKMEFSGSFGLHITDLKVGLNLVDEIEKSFSELTAPLPALGLAYKYRFNDAWELRVRGEWLDIKVGDVNGSLTSAIIDASWHPWDNFGFSLGYNLWELDIKASATDLTGRVTYKFNGPELGFRVRF